MKKIINKIAIFTVALLTLNCSDPDNVIYDVLDKTTYGVAVRHLELTNLNYNIFNLESAWDVTVEVQDETKGAEFKELAVFVTYKDNKDDGVDNSKTETLIATVPASDFGKSEANLPSTRLKYTLSTVLNKLGLSEGQYFGGDDLTFRLEARLNDGRTFSAADGSGSLQGSYFKSPYQYKATILCIPEKPIPGDYKIEMTDTYGDGWQTSESNGGKGITVTLNDGTVIEVGLCSRYDPRPNCTANESAGTATVTIPEGTESAEWNFPGDKWGEITFKIYAPSGNLIADYGVNSPAGKIALNLCNEEVPQ